MWDLSLQIARETSLNSIWLVVCRRVWSVSVNMKGAWGLAGGKTLQMDMSRLCPFVIHLKSSMKLEGTQKHTFR